MACDSVLYRFEVELSDSDRGVFTSLSFRAPFHPSEAPSFFAARVLAYCLHFQDGLEMSQGVSDTELPALRMVGPDGSVPLWIEVGQPSAERLHKASKTGARVLVYSHKEPYQYLKNLSGGKIHRASDIKVYSFEPGFLEAVGRALGRDNRWSLTVTGGTLYLSAGGKDLTSERREASPAAG